MPYHTLYQMSSEYPAICFLLYQDFFRIFCTTGSGSGLPHHYQKGETHHSIHLHCPKNNRDPEITVTLAASSSLPERGRHVVLSIYTVPKINGFRKLTLPASSSLSERGRHVFLSVYILHCPKNNRDPEINISGFNITTWKGRHSFISINTVPKINGIRKLTLSASSSIPERGDTALYPSTLSQNYSGSGC